ncbi:MAG: hypothetical protein U5K75_11830 [Ahrensia sp.]|nr:hypothetical protein [Ahrensia sp.]
MPVEPCEPLTFGDILLRLKAVKKALIDLKRKSALKRFSFKFEKQAFGQRVAVETTVFSSLLLKIKSAALHSRAPPVLTRNFFDPFKFFRIADQLR